jgi:L-galactose dehydrogenase
MKRRTLGSTGMKVSVLGFGCGRFSERESDSIAAIHQALEAGINYFDVAPLYGGFEAERTLGRALQGVNRSAFFVATKVGRYLQADGTRVSDFSAERVTRSVEESLTRLALSYVDVIQIHDGETAPVEQLIEETLPALLAIRASGKARFIGVTGFPLKLFQILLRRAPRHSFDVILSYGHYTLQNTTLVGLMTDSQNAGVGIVNAAPFGMGFFTGRTNWWHPIQHTIAAECQLAAAHCREVGIDLPRLALQFSTGNQNFSTTLVSMPTPREVTANVSAMNAQLDHALVNDVQAILASVRDQKWPSGRPEYNS